MAANGSIGLEAVGAASFGLSDDLAAQMREIAWRRDRCSIGTRDDGGNAGGHGKLVLDALDFIELK